MTLLCRLTVISALLGLTHIAQVAAGPVSVNSSLAYTQTLDGTSSDTDLDSSTAYGTRTLFSSSGGSSSTTYFNWQDTGSGTLFDYDFDQVRTGTSPSYAYTRDNGFMFTVGPNDTTYSLSGLFSMTGPANRTYAHVHLLDLSRGGYLFRDFNESRNTANEIFALGVAGDGDFGNITLGSLTGTLFAGRQYQFFFEEFIQAFPRADNGATATGCVTLSIGGATGAGDCGRVAMVTEPGSLALAGLALAGLGLARRKVRPA